MLGQELTGLQSYLITELDFPEVNFYVCANADLKLLCCLFSFFWTKCSFRPLGFFSLHGLLEVPSAVCYGKE